MHVVPLLFLERMSTIKKSSLDMLRKLAPHGCLSQIASQPFSRPFRPLREIISAWPTSQTVPLYLRLFLGALFLEVLGVLTSSHSLKFL